MRGWKHRGGVGRGGWRGLPVPAVFRPRVRRLSLAVLTTALVGGVVWFGVSLVAPRGAGQNLRWLAAPTTNRPRGCKPSMTFSPSAASHHIFNVVNNLTDLARPTRHETDVHRISPVSVEESRVMYFA